jgi:hypothetical protein
MAGPRLTPSRFVMAGRGSRRYLACAALLAVHEVDSGIWREWDLFELPGGAATFVALHLPLFLLLVWGYGQVVLGTNAGRRVSLLLAVGALAGGALHAALLGAGHPEFRTAGSLALLGGLAASGAALLPAGLRPRYRPRRANALVV